MGCDIHAYIEYRKPRTEHWYGFGERINPGRNYAIFGRLAGVRTDGPPVAPLRGLPKDVAHAVREDGFLFVTEDGAGDDCCTLEEGRRWSGDPNIKLHDFVPHPDWHSHSWLTPDEFEKALQKAQGDYPDIFEPEYQAVLDAMRSFERTGHEVRIVFWFDN